jgi:hypothetical protein
MPGIVIDTIAGEGDVAAGLIAPQAGPAIVVDDIGVESRVRHTAELHTAASPIQHESLGVVPVHLVALNQCVDVLVAEDPLEPALGDLVVEHARLCARVARAADDHGRSVRVVELVILQRPAIAPLVADCASQCGIGGMAHGHALDGNVV